MGFICGGRRRPAVVAALFSVGLLTATSPAPASAEVSGVGGSAFGYYTSVAFDFGGGPGPPQETGPEPTVTLPSTGGSETATLPSGRAEAGPAVFFESGPITVSTEGSTGPTGFSTSSVSITQDKAGVDPFYFSTVNSTCASSEAGTTASTTLTGGAVNLGNGDGAALPDDPLPNTEYFGTIDGVDDRFRLVLNEQVVASDSITVTAMHLYLLGPTANGDVFVGQLHCDVAATSANQDPVANDDTFDTGGTATLEVPAPGLLENDTDPEGGPLTAQVQTRPTKGTVTVNLDGSFTYTPNLTFDGTDTFTYLALDPRGANIPATVTVTGPSAKPANDDFEDAEVISGSTGSVTGNNVNATQLDGEGPTAASIWYQWAAPQDGVFAWDTCGTAFPNQVVNAFVDGPSNENLVPEQNRFDTYPLAECAGERARYLMRATAGTVYHIAVGGLGEMGDTVLSWSPLPQAPNDDFVNAQIITGPSGSVTGSTGPDNVSTFEPGEETDGNTIWYRWAAPADGEVTFETCGSSFPTGLAVSTGDAIDALTRMGPSPNLERCDSGARGRVIFDAVAGTTYHIAVEGAGDTFGTVVLEWSQVLSNQAPVAVDDAYAHYGSDTPLTVSAPGVLSNDTDADNNPVTASLVTGPSRGALMLSPDGSFSYQPDEDQVGVDSFTYTATDGTGDSNTATVTITVGAGCRGTAATITGTSGRDRLVGTGGSDVIAGLGGDDTLDGHGGNDVICGGSGGDTVHAGGGDDDVDGGSGDDRLQGSNGNDTLLGGDGADVLTGDDGNDLLSGGTGSTDRCRGGRGTDSLVAPHHGCETTSGIP